MQDLKNEIEQMSRILECIENNVNSEKYENICQRAGLKSAFKEKKIKEKIKLCIDLLLERLGRIPYCSVDEYRVDIELRSYVQELRTKVILLEYLQKEKKRKTEKKFVEVNIPAANNLEKKSVSLEKLKKGYIAFIVNSLDKGGLEQVVALLAKGFYEQNISVKVICLDEGGWIAEQLEQAGIEVNIFHGNGRSFRSYIKKNPPILANTHYVKRHIKFMYKQGIPTVEVIHNMYVYYCDHVAKIERKNEKYFTKLIAVSEIVKETYQQRITDSNKIVVIGNAAELRAVPKRSRGEIRKAFQIPEDAFVILNVGSIDPRKNQLGILEAFNIISEISDTLVYLIFAGNIQDEIYSNIIIQKIQRIDENKRKQIRIFPYYKNVRELYCMSDVFLLDSYYEGWSIAATEALYDGLPIIHSKCGSAVELTDKGRYGKVISNPGGDLRHLKKQDLVKKIARYEYENTEEIVKVIREMIGERKQWEEYRGIIKQETYGKFSQENMINNYTQLFEKILSEERSYKERWEI